MIEQVIGVDCATNPRNVGLACARLEGERFRLHAAAACSLRDPPQELVASWIEEASGASLLTLDAPLGWPRPLGEAIASHSAGNHVAGSANALFRRETDRDIAKRFGKTPLDVGADRIARTAHWALSLLEVLRDRTGEPIPLVWSGTFDKRVGAIEVYPAATMLAHGVQIRGYKGAEPDVPRSAIYRLISGKLDVPPDVSQKSWSTDVLDAVVCVVAGVDFVRGECKLPDNLDLAHREGWIWVAATPRDIAS